MRIVKCVEITFHDDHPDGSAREEEVDISVMQLVEVQRVETLFSCDQNVLVTCLRMNPRGLPKRSEQSISKVNKQNVATVITVP